MKRTNEPTTATIRPEDHGTPRGYMLGCRLDDCPGLTRAGRNRSCVQAFKEQQQDRNDTRTKRAAAGLAKPAPAAPAQPAQSEDAVTDPKVARPGFNDRQIREWAHANGIDPGTRGPLKTTARAAYEAALQDEHPKPKPPSKPLTVEPISTEAAAAGTDTHTLVGPHLEQRAATLTAEIERLQRDLAAKNEELEREHTEHFQTEERLDQELERTQHLRTALAAEEEAHALTRKRYDDELAEVRRRHAADAKDLEESRATQLSETRRANELEERLAVEEAAGRALDRVATSYVPEVVPAATASTVMTVGDVRLELPAGEVAQLKVDVGGVHVQIGR